MKNILIAVYGTLRLGHGNYEYFLKANNAIYLGEFQTEPKYTMYSIFDGYPALVKNGKTSIVMNVFRVDEKTLSSVDGLEGYSEGRKDNHYDRIKINTPWGEAYCYIYDEAPEDCSIIESGDWTEYKNIKSLQNAL